MKLLEQYLIAVGRKLPLRTREDIKNELRSLLLDEIESKYGENPTESDIGKALKDFGSPAEVAARYRGYNRVIAEGFTDIYFLILKIMAGGMAVAFTVVFIVELFQNNPSGPDLVKAVFQVPFRTFSAFLSGTGGLTLVFIIISRFFRDKAIDLHEDWTPEELKGIQLDDAGESRLESIIGIVVLSIFSVLMIIYPGVVIALEDLFALSGIPLGHRIDLEVFRYFAGVLALLWIGELAVQIVVLKRGTHKRISALRTAIDGLEAGLFTVLVVYDGVYLYNTGIIGFKVIFSILAVIGIIETGGRIVKLVRRTIARRLG